MPSERVMLDAFEEEEVILNQEDRLAPPDDEYEPDICISFQESW